MAKITKRFKAINEKLTPGKQYSAEEGLGLLKELASAKFKEAVEIAVSYVAGGAAKSPVFTLNDRVAIG